MSDRSESIGAPEIYGLLAKVIGEVGSVGKTRKNLQQNYQFRGVDDVMAAVQGLFAKHGVVCVPRVVEREREMVQTKSGGSMASVRLLVDHHFFAPDGSSVVCTTLGEAMDSGDKASNKAMSAALKYALTETLCIPTYEVDRDTEEQSPEVKPERKPPQPVHAPKPSAPRSNPTEGVRTVAFPVEVMGRDGVIGEQTAPARVAARREVTSEDDATVDHLRAVLHRIYRGDGEAEKRLREEWLVKAMRVKGVPRGKTAYGMFATGTYEDRSRVLHEAKRFEDMSKPPDWMAPEREVGADDA